MTKATVIKDSKEYRCDDCKLIFTSAREFDWFHFDSHCKLNFKDGKWRKVKIEFEVCDEA